MKEPSIRFAIAVNHSNNFELKHFGEAYKYLIYELTDGEFKLIVEQQNEFKSINDETNHGSKEKGSSIIKLLKGNKVRVLVSRQFGRNMKMINRHFVPVVVHNDNLSQTRSVLIKNRKWIEDELDSRMNGYKLFAIDKGVLKRNIK